MSDCRGVVRRTDLTSGHAGYNPTYGTSWSPDTFVNNLNVERYTDSLQIHCNPNDCHGLNYNKDRKSIVVNGLGLQLKGDPTTCGDTCNGCSSDTFGDGD